MTRWEAHAACIALVVCDALARSLRTHWILRGIGVPTTFRTCLVANGIGDVAAALSPMRVLGVPAQLTTLARRGVPSHAAFAALGVDALASYPVVGAVGLGLALAYGASWWTDVVPRLTAAASAFAPAVALVLLACVPAAWGARRLARYVEERRVSGGTGAANAVGRRTARGMAATIASLRSVQPWAVAASVPLTLVSVIARVLVLPTLAHALPVPPPFGVSLLGSFAMLYGQLALPTPSGIGVMEIAGSAGIAGPLGGSAAWVLFWWRAYTSGAPMLVAIPLVLRRRAR
jgi:uncharacterized membrane protein YbhN (UPF0104 family)